MWRLRGWLAVVFLALGLFPAAAADLAKVDRSIGKEPPFRP
jgi:hypothetical protein